MKSYILSSKADIDLDSIADYSLEFFGESQTRIYLTNLLHCFQTLADKPKLGRSAAEYALPLKRYNYEAHTIFYEPTKTGIFVVRILRQQQDFGRHL